MAALPVNQDVPAIDSGLPTSLPRGTTSLDLRAALAAGAALLGVRSVSTLLKRSLVSGKLKRDPRQHDHTRTHFKETPLFR